MLGCIKNSKDIFVVYGVKIVLKTIEGIFKSTIIALQRNKNLDLYLEAIKDIILIESDFKI